MAKQATHKGECQMCGRVQKLPGGKLAKHGYTTRWGFFSGVCTGAHHAPYEQSCEMLKERLPLVIEAANGQRELAAKARATTDAAWVVEAFKPRDPRSYVVDYLARLVPVAELTHSERYRRGVLSYTHSKPEALPNGKKAEHEFAYGEGLTMADAVAVLNERRARDHEAQAKRLEDYAAWCSNRITSWKLRELAPVNSADEAPKSPACPKCGGRRAVTLTNGDKLCRSKPRHSWQQCGHTFNVEA
jgi:hypothetical protein